MFTEDHLKPGFEFFIISNEVYKHSVKECQHQIYLSMWSYRITVVKNGCNAVFPNGCNTVFPNGCNAVFPNGCNTIFPLFWYCTEIYHFLYEYERKIFQLKKPMKKLIYILFIPFNFFFARNQCFSPFRDIFYLFFIYFNPPKNIPSYYPMCCSQ